MASEAEVYRSYSDAASEAPEDNKLSAERMRKQFSDAYRAQSEWRQNVVENLKMLNGDQWTDEQKARLAEQNMAPIVINKMIMPVLFLSGVQRQTRQEAKLLPFEGGDVRATEIMNTLIHWAEQQNDADEKDSQVFLDKAAVGLGWWKITWDFDSTDDPEGSLSVRRRHMLSVFPDPNWLDSGDWNDAQYVFDALWFTPEEAADKWPEHASTFKREPGEWLRVMEGDSSGAGGIAEHSGDSLSAERLFFDPVAKRVRIVECWYKEKREVTIAFNQETQSVIHEAERVERLQAILPQLAPEEQSKLLFIKKRVPVVRVAHLFHDTILDFEDSPYEEPCFPLFPAKGMYFWKNPFGLADLMKDLQREKNKRRSKLIELVGRMPLSGFFNHETEGADPKQIEEYGAGNGIVINYKGKEPAPIRPPDLPMAVIRLEDKSDEEIKDVPNVHDELLGQATQKTISGRAIEARQRGGLVSHEHLFDTFRKEKRHVIKFEVGLLKQYLSPTKALRILGMVAERDPESEVGMMMQQAMENPIDSEAILDALSTAYDIDYDVVISSRPTEPSLAMQAWETLAELQTQGAAIPPKTLWQAAEKAGILTQDQVAEILQFVQEQMQAQQAQQGQPPAPSPGQTMPAAAPGPPM